MNYTTQRCIQVLTTRTRDCSLNLEIGSLGLHSKVSPNPTGLSVLITGKGHMKTEIHRENAMCCSFKESQRSMGCPYKLERGKKGLPPESQREHNPENTLTSDTSPPELRGHERLWFVAAQFGVLCCRSPSKLIPELSNISQEKHHLDIDHCMVITSNNHGICCVSLHLLLLHIICQVLSLQNHKIF